MLRLDIPAEAWKEAEKYFEKSKNQKGVTFSTPNPEYPSHNFKFICVDGQVYAKQTKDCLGKGGFGKVQLIETKEGKQFAVKIEGRGLKSEKDAELQILSLLGKFHGQAAKKLDKEKEVMGTKTKQKLYTVMDLEKGEDLSKFLRKNANSANTYVDYADYYAGNEPNQAAQNANNTQNLHIAFMCTQQIANLHAHNIVHSDIKPQNFLISLQGEMITVAPIDFGLSNKVKPGTTSVVVQSDKPIGTPGYTPPEVRFPKGEANTDAKNTAKERSSGMTYDKSKGDRVMSFSGDVYSLGVMFRDDLKLPPAITDPMLRANPKDRPSISEVMKTLAQHLKESKDFDLRGQEQKNPLSIGTTQTTTVSTRFDAKPQAPTQEQGNPLMLTGFSNFKATTAAQVGKQQTKAPSEDKTEHAHMKYS